MKPDSRTEAVERIRALYEKHPEARECGYDRNQTVEDALAKFESNPPTDFSVESLEACRDKAAVSIVLGHLPQKAVMAEFGEEVSLWTWFRYPDYLLRCGDLEKEISEIRGLVKPHTLNHVRISLTDAHSPGFPEFLRFYHLAETVQKRVAEETDLPKLLQKNALPGVVISLERAADYGLIPLSPEQSWSGGDYDADWYRRSVQATGGTEKKFKIYLDAPIGIGLTYREEPNAVGSVCPTGPESLTICQLQGVRPMITDANGRNKKGSSRGLAPIEYRKLLVDIWAELAGDAGFSEVGIQGAKNNQWVKLNRLAPAAARRTYDQTAEEMGFERRKDGNWYKPLKSGPSGAPCT